MSIYINLYHPVFKCTDVVSFSILRNCHSRSPRHATAFKSPDSVGAGKSIPRIDLNLMDAIHYRDYTHYAKTQFSRPEAETYRKMRRRETRTPRWKCEREAKLQRQCVVCVCLRPSRSQVRYRTVALFQRRPAEPAKVSNRLCNK